MRAMASLGRTSLTRRFGYCQGGISRWRRGTGGVDVVFGPHHTTPSESGFLDVRGPCHG